jgi:uncharacterized protein DUF4157
MAGALPRALRSDLEMMFGASFRDVRIHQLAPDNGTVPVACTRGADIYLAAGAYDPHSRAGRDVLGHELAHVLQQRGGRAGWRASRWLLEVEAATAGRAVAHGAPAQVPGGTGRPATRGRAAAQHYTVVAPGAFAGQGIAVLNPQFHLPSQAQDSYLGQIKGGLLALNPGSFMRAAGGVQIVSANPAAVSLRLSANGNMAIEDADILTRQPKVFYATQALITESNDRLTLLNSDIRLDVGGPGLPRITVGGQTLLRVTPRNVATGTAGLAMTAPQPCDVLVEHVTGSTFLAPQFEAPLNPGPPLLVEYGVARLLLAPPPAVLDPSTPANLATTMGNIATPYANAARAPAGAFTASLQLYGLNQFTHPEVGEGFVTSTLLAPAAGAGVQQGAMPPTHTDHYNLAGPVPQVLINDRTWGSHWGGVVAKDGADVVTLENYARNTEDALAGADTRYYFQMYSTNPAGPGSTWHRAWTTTAMQQFGAPGAPPAPPAPAPPHLQATHQPASPGARSFANPITMRIAVPDGHYDAVAATLYGAVNIDTIKNDYNLIAGAVTAQQEMQEIMKGLQYANLHLANHQAALTARANQWTNALTNAIAAAAFRQNLQALRYTRTRIGAMNLH